MMAGKILKRQGTHVRFRNEDMDFVFNWMLGYSSLAGLSHGELFALASTIQDGNVDSWVKAFGDQAIWLEHELDAEENASTAKQASRQFGIFHSLRAMLQFADPTVPEFEALVEKMESHFQRGCQLGGYPLDAVEIPFEDASLSGYLIRSTSQGRPTLIIIGGGDTFREDLFYFGGIAGYGRDYNILMVDLPGQGKMPLRGLTFRHDTEKPVSRIVDWLADNQLYTPGKLAIFGLSGGGYFTARAVSYEKRISAWVASTPIASLPLMFEREMPKAVLSVPGWLARLLIRVAGVANKVTEVNIKKYFWQAGVETYEEAVEKIIRYGIVDPQSITCHCMFLVGENEGKELIRQTEELYDYVKDNPKNKLRRFSAAEGGDAHCQINNLKLAHIEVFEWLDAVLE